MKIEDLESIVNARLQWYRAGHKKVSFNVKDPIAKLRREADAKDAMAIAVLKQMTTPDAPEVSDKDRPRRGRVVADDLRTLALILEAPEPKVEWRSEVLFDDEECPHGRMRPYIWKGEDEESSEPDVLVRCCRECEREYEEERRRMVAGIFE